MNLLKKTLLGFCRECCPFEKMEDFGDRFDKFARGGLLLLLGQVL